MKILIVGLVKNKQLKRLQEEGNKKGHQVDGCYPSSLTISASPEEFTPCLFGKDLSSYDLVYLWAIGKNRRWNWYVVAQYLNQRYQTRIVNQKILDPSYLYYLSPASDYLKQTKNNLPFPKTIIFTKTETISSVIKDFNFPAILKISPSGQGKGVFKVNSEEDIKDIVEQKKDIATAFILRQFIPNNGDVRVFTVGYKAIGAMKRTPKQGDFRSNISQGGSGSVFDLTKNTQIQNIAEKISQLTKTEIAGVDIMINKETNKPYILEINHGPQFTGLEKYTKTNAAKKIIEYFETLI